MLEFRRKAIDCGVPVDALQSRRMEVSTEMEKRKAIAEAEEQKRAKAAAPPKKKGCAARPAGGSTPHDGKES